MQMAAARGSHLMSLGAFASFSNDSDCVGGGSMCVIASPAHPQIAFGLSGSQRTHVSTESSAGRMLLQGPRSRQHGLAQSLAGQSTPDYFERRNPSSRYHTNAQALVRRNMRMLWLVGRRHGVRMGVVGRHCSDSIGSTRPILRLGSTCPMPLGGKRQREQIEHMPTQRRTERAESADSGGGADPTRSSRRRGSGTGSAPAGDRRMNA